MNLKNFYVTRIKDMQEIAESFFGKIAIQKEEGKIEVNNLSFSLFMKLLDKALPNNVIGDMSIKDIVDEDWKNEKCDEE